MKKATCTCLLAVSLLFFVKEGVCQKAAEVAFFKITQSYLKYSTKKFGLDSNTTVFFVAANNRKPDQVSFEIIFTRVDLMIDTKYNEIYKLENYKLIVFEGPDQNTEILKKIFKPTVYENLNKGKEDDVIRDNFERWVINLNNKYEITSVSAPKEAIKLLKENKVRFSKKFKFK